MPLSTGVRQVMREAGLWAVVLGAGFAGVFYFDELRGLVTDTKRMAVTAYEDVRLSARQRDTSDGFERSVTLRAERNGHFFARAHINGRPIAVLVDTGATGVALSYEDARRIGLEPRESDYTLRARTANGLARAAPITLDRIRIGDIEVKNLRGTVAQPGALHITLLGMEFIGRLSRFELRGDELELVQ